MRCIFPSLYGNEKLRQTVGVDILRGRNAHAFILEGPAGSGKYTAAIQICASLMCLRRDEKYENYSLPCGECEQCSRVLRGKSVDVLTIDKGDKATLGVDRIRELTETLYVTPNEGDVKAYIIRDADTMTVQAQNSLLLSLEEPPSFVVFLLLCEDSSKLLPTVRSRAPIVRMELFDANTLTEYLNKNCKGASSQPDRTASAVHLSGGAIGAAAALFQNEKSELSLYNTASKLSLLLAAGRKSDALVFVNSEMPKERADTVKVLNMTRNAVRDMIADKKDVDSLFFPPDFAYSKEIKRTSVRKLLSLDTALTDAIEDIDANCSQNTVLSLLVLRS